MPNVKKENTFENKFNRLEEISELLEGNDITLDEAIKLYEEGILLSKECITVLENAEIKITDLKNSIKNNVKLSPDDSFED